MSHLPKSAELVFELNRGESIKYDVYFKTVAKTGGVSKEIYSTGYATYKAEDVLQTGDATVRLSGEFTSGMIGEPIEKHNFSCTATISKTGNILSSDCDMSVPSIQLPDRPVSIGDEWSYTLQTHDEKSRKYPNHRSCPP